jgi:quercetin dioxygenase-like cupin family protein
VQQQDRIAVPVDLVMDGKPVEAREHRHPWIIEAMSLLVRPGEGHQLGGSFDVLVRVRSEQTAGVMAVIEETLTAGAFITPHTHRNDVWVHVLTGEVGVLVGEETAKAEAGAWALKPRNVLHAMWNAGSEPARIIEVLTPGGTERWFEEIAALPPGDEAGFRDACKRHGIAFFPDSPWTATLRERYGLLPKRMPAVRAVPSRTAIIFGRTARQFPWHPGELGVTVVTSWRWPAVANYRCPVAN